MANTKLIEQIIEVYQETEQNQYGIIAAEDIAHTLGYVANKSSEDTQSRPMSSTWYTKVSDRGGVALDLATVGYLYLSGKQGQSMAEIYYTESSELIKKYKSLYEDKLGTGGAPTRQDLSMGKYRVKFVPKPQKKKIRKISLVPSNGESNLVPSNGEIKQRVYSILNDEAVTDKYREVYKYTMSIEHTLSPSTSERMYDWLDKTLLQLDNSRSRVWTCPKTEVV